MEVHRKRQEAQQLAVKRGLAPNQKALSTKSSTPRSLSPLALLGVPGGRGDLEARAPGWIFAVEGFSDSLRMELKRSGAPLGLAPAAVLLLGHSQTLRGQAADQSDSMPFPSFVDSQTMPDSSGFYVDESDYSSKAVTPNRPLSIKEEVREDRRGEDDGEAFVPARLPNFGSE